MVVQIVSKQVRSKGKRRIFNPNHTYFDASVDGIERIKQAIIRHLTLDI